MTHTARTLLCSIFLLGSFDASAATHCTSGEIDYFTCKIKDSEKIVSLCGGLFRDDTYATSEINSDAWIQYRFGKKGSIQLTYPAKKKQPLGKYFSGDYILANDARVYSLTFKSGSYTYEIQSSPGMRGILVLGRGIKLAMPCDGEPKIMWAPNLNNFYQLVEDLNRQE